MWQQRPLMASAGGGGQMSEDVFDKCANPRIEEYRAAQAIGLVPFFQEG